MEVELEKVGENKVKMTITVERESVDEALKKAAKKLAKSVKLSGFRPGRAPRAVLEKAVGKDLIAREAMEKLIPEAYIESVKAKGITPIDQPQIEPVQLPQEGKPFSFSAVVETKPEVKLGKYLGLTLEKEDKRVGPQEEEQALRDLIEQKAILAPTDEPARQGHVVEIEFQGYQEGEKLSDFKGETTAELGSGRLMKDLEQAVLAMKVGERKRIRIKLNESFPLQKYRGQEVDIEVTLKECKEKTLPELNDLFAQSLGFEDLEELKKSVRKTLEAQLAQHEKEKALHSLVKAATDNAETLVPEVLAKREVDRIIRQVDMNLRYYGLDVEDYIKDGKLKDRSEQHNVEQAAREKVKMDLVLEEIAKKENIKVSEAEFARVLLSMAEQLKKDPKFVLEKIRENGEDQEIMAQLLRYNTMQYLLDHSIVKMVKKERSPG